MTSINTGWSEAKKQLSVAVQPYFLIRHELSVHGGIVFRGERVVVPAALTSRLVNFLLTKTTRALFVQNYDYEIFIGDQKWTCR